ncbi:polyphosphate kinase [Spirochaetia bacterium]|nr:polyphosphate kinase [Spirochaetia bacterium]
MEGAEAEKKTSQGPHPARRFLDKNALGERFLNRELSWIDFNNRVLEEGLRKDLPPLERFRFLSIVSANFDDFFMIRMAALKRAIRGEKYQDPSRLSAEEQLKAAAEKIRSMIHRLYACLEEEVFPVLTQGGLELLRPGSYSGPQGDYLNILFSREILPILTPLRLEDEGLPSIANGVLYGAFLLTRAEPAGETPAESGERISLVQIPPILDRIVWLPTGGTAGEGKTCWALLDDLVINWGGALFPGYQVREKMLFRVHRDADFSVDEKRDEDFIEAMEEVLVGREHSPAVRMVYSSGSARLRDELARRLGLEEHDLYNINGPLSLGSLYSLVQVRGFEHLKERPRKQFPHPAFSCNAGDEPIWDRLSQGDVLLELPYRSFDPVVRFFQDAAVDPQVIAIKTALYRTSGNSPIVKALEQAALNGKHVTAVVELKARFDEEQNITWANRLENAGVIVIYGLSQLKVHAKITLVIRRELRGIRRYIHLSTGNYNDKTAKQYSDLGLFTAQEDIGFDASSFFNMITGYSEIQSMRKLVIAPPALKRRLLKLIDREARRSLQGSPGRIMAKMNALVDSEVIDALYRAGRAGVQISLNIRGICSLIPGRPGLSENIRVVSIVGHYLEHSRIFYFANGGAEEFYISSADWMPRNLERRVELMIPILQENIKEQVRDILDVYFRDNVQAWDLDGEGKWKRRIPPKGEKPFSAQEYFLSRAEEEAENPRAPKQEFVVRRSPPTGE